MRQEGGITVFLALVMPVISAFILLLASTARGYMSKSEAKLAVDNAVRSCFAEYNRELFERFHILLIDSSYKGYENGSGMTEGHFRTYLENSITENEICSVEVTGYGSGPEMKQYIYDAAVRYARENLAFDRRFSAAGDDGWFLTYLISVCGNDDVPCLEAYRTGEIEYLLYASGSDDENIMNLRMDHGDDPEESYEDYLCRRLEGEDIPILLDRFIQLVSEYMKVNGSPGFDTDECYYDLAFTAGLQNRQGKQYSIEKRYAYGTEGI